MSADMLNAAVYCASRGWPIFPIHTPIDGGRCSCGKDCGKQCGKHPRTAHGLDDASIDLDQIREWWARWPSANIAVRTGVICDMFDIDNDDQLDGTADMPVIHLPGGPVVRTGQGWHYYFAPTGLGNRTRFTEHCDWRGQGGYSILPPSLHRSGRRYEWFTPTTVPLNPPPAELLELLTIEPSSPTPSQRPACAAIKVDKDRFTRGRWTASGLIGRLAIAADGTRNDTLVWAANKIGLDYFQRKATKAEVDRALDQLHDVAVRCGLTDRETAATIKSGFLKGAVGKVNFTGRSAAK
jgi:hypothetical protein